MELVKEWGGEQETSNMIRVVNTDVLNWNENIKSIRSNFYTDSITTIKIMNKYGILLNENGLVKLLYYDPFLKATVIVEEGEVLEFIDGIASKQNEKIGCNEHVDIILNIICKKVGMNCISDLKMCHIDSYIYRFIDRTKYDEEWLYIFEYLK